MSSNPKNPQNRKTPAPEQTELMAHAIKLWTAGLHYDQIGKEMGSSASTAYRRVKSGIQFYLKDNGADQAGAQMQLQLLSAIRAIWPKVLQGDIAAGNLLVRYQARWAALTGADAPTRHVVNVLTEDAVDAAIRELEAEMRQKALAPVRAEEDEAIMVSAEVVIR